MRVDNFQFQIYGDENFDRLINPKKVLNGLSVFMLLGKCLEKADKSGDGVVSKEELNIFRAKNSAQIIREIQKEIPSYELEVDDVDLLQLMDSVKGMIAKNNEINEDVNTLKGMTKEEFIKTAEQKALGENEENNFEEIISEDEANLAEENLQDDISDPLEESESADSDTDGTQADIKQSDENSQNEQAQNGADTLWQMIYADGAENIFDKMDTDGNGTLSEEELLAISGGDGKNDNISITDLSKLFSFGYVNDMEEPQNNGENAQNTTDIFNDNSGTDTPSADSSSGTYSPEASGNSGNTSGSGNYSGGNSGNYDSADTPQPEQKAKTSQEVEAQIQEQEQNKTSIKEKAQQDIQAQQAQIDDLINNSDLSDDFKKEYEAENTRLQGLIDENNAQITAQKTIIQDSTAKISSYNIAMGDIDSQIQTLTTQKGQQNSENKAETDKEFDSKIEALKAEKVQLQKNIDAENEKLNNANSLVSELEKTNTDLTTEKDNVLDKLSEKYTSEKAKVEEIKTQIQNHKTEIDNLKSNLDKEIVTIDGNIQTLKTEKENLIQKEKTDKIIAENTVLPDNAPYQLTADPKSFDWTSIGYNTEAGKQIAEGVYKYASGRTGNHQCLGGVKKGFNKAFGTNPFKDIGAGYKAAGVLENDKNFREVTGLTIDQLKYLPAGAVVSWSQSDGSSPASKYGHCSVSLGDGNEASDHICKQYRHVGSNGKPRVFIPISDPSKYKEY